MIGSDDAFFCVPAIALAASLLGKVLCAKQNKKFISCCIVETEAYTYIDKASHSSRGRKGSEPMFDRPGTIYMYKIRQWHSLNISSLGYGCGVLIKGAIGYKHAQGIKWDNSNYIKGREFSGQGLLCKELGLQTSKWNGKQFDSNLYLQDIGYTPSNFLITPRLGVTKDAQLPYRFVDYAYLKYATASNIKAQWKTSNSYRIFSNKHQAIYYVAKHKEKYSQL